MGRRSPLAPACRMSQEFGKGTSPHEAQTIPGDPNWNLKYIFPTETVWQDQLGLRALGGRQMSDKVVLTGLLWSLSGLMNNQSFRALFVLAYNSSILQATPASQGWPDDLTTLLLWENAFQTIKTSKYGFFIHWGTATEFIQWLLTQDD